MLLLLNCRVEEYRAGDDKLHRPTAPCGRSEGGARRLPDLPTEVDRDGITGSPLTLRNCCAKVVRRASKERGSLT